MFITKDNIQYNILEFTAYRLINTKDRPFGLEVHYAGGTKIQLDFNDDSEREDLISQLGSTYIELNSIHYNVLYFTSYYSETIKLPEPSYNVVAHYGGYTGGATKLVFKFASEAERTEFIDLIESIGTGGGGGGGESADAKLTENITSNVTVGAAPANTLFKKNTSFTEFAKKILLKEIAPSVTFTSTGSGTHEIGTIVSNPTLTLKINSLGTGKPTSIEFYVDNVLLDTQPYISGTNTYTYNHVGDIRTTCDVKAKLIYNKSDKTSTSISTSIRYTFVYASYYGIVSSLTPSESDITALTKTVKTTKSFTWNNINCSDERFCYAYPKSQGNLVSIKDSNNFEYIGSYTFTTIQINSVDYYLYVLTDPTTVSGFKQIYS